MTELTNRITQLNGNNNGHISQFKHYSVIISTLPPKKEKYKTFSDAAVKEIKGSMFRGLRRSLLEYTDLHDLLDKMRTIAFSIDTDISTLHSGLKSFKSKGYGDNKLDNLLDYETNNILAPFAERVSKSKDLMSIVVSAMSDYNRIASAVEFSCLHPELKEVSLTKLTLLREYVAKAVNNLFVPKNNGDKCAL